MSEHWLYRFAHWWTTHIPYITDIERQTRWIDQPPPTNQEDPDEPRET